MVRFVEKKIAKETFYSAKRSIKISDVTEEMYNTKNSNCKYTSIPK